MPHLAMVALSGFRVREPEMLELGMQLPGLHDRAMAIAALPALGLLTLAGMTPQDWSVSYHDPAVVDQDIVEQIVRQQPKLVAISALTASWTEQTWRYCCQHGDFAKLQPTATRISTATELSTALTWPCCWGSGADLCRQCLLRWRLRSGACR